MTIAALEEGFKPYSAWVKVPILIAGEQSSTTVEPMKSMIDELRRTETQPGIMAASYLMGFPWADNEDSSCAVYVVADSQELADKEAIRLADEMWNRRHEFCFQTETYPEKEAIDVAFKAIQEGHETPVYLSDSGDNPTAGSSSDCTGFLRLLMETAAPTCSRPRFCTAASMTRKQPEPAKVKLVRKSPSPSAQNLTIKPPSRSPQPELLWLTSKTGIILGKMRPCSVPFLWC